RARPKNACDGLAAAPHDATGEAISNHTPAVDGDSTRATESLVCKGVLGRKEVSTRKVSIVNRSHGSLLRMQIRAGTFSRIISRQGPLRWFSPRRRAGGRASEKSWGAFSALGGGFLLFPIGDRRCNRTRASVGNAGGNARPSLTNATLAASRLLHRRSPTAPCPKGALAAHRKKLAAFSALGGDCGSQRGPGSVIIL